MADRQFARTTDVDHRLPPYFRRGSPIPPAFRRPSPFRFGSPFCRPLSPGFSLFPDWCGAYDRSRFQSPRREVRSFFRHRSPSSDDHRRSWVTSRYDDDDAPLRDYSPRPRDASPQHRYEYYDEFYPRDYARSRLARSPRRGVDYAECRDVDRPLRRSSSRSRVPRRDRDRLCRSLGATSPSRYTGYSPRRYRDDSPRRYRDDSATRYAGYSPRCYADSPSYAPGRYDEQRRGPYPTRPRSLSPVPYYGTRTERRSPSEPPCGTSRPRSPSQAYRRGRDPPRRGMESDDYIADMRSRFMRDSERRRMLDDDERRAMLERKRRQLQQDRRPADISRRPDIPGDDPRQSSDQGGRYQTSGERRSAFPDSGQRADTAAANEHRQFSDTERNPESPDSRYRGPSDNMTRPDLASTGPETRRQDLPAAGIHHRPDEQAVLSDSEGHGERRPAEYPTQEARMASPPRRREPSMTRQPAGMTGDRATAAAMAQRRGPRSIRWC